MIEECNKDSQGLLHGIYISWYENGQLEEEAEFFHGRVCGYWKYYNTDGLIWFNEYLYKTIREGESIEYGY